MSARPRRARRNGARTDRQPVGITRPGRPLACIADGSAAGIPLLVGTTREEFRLRLVPPGLAAAVTPDALPWWAARFGWPPRATDPYAANRPGGSPGDIARAILTDGWQPWSPDDQAVMPSDVSSHLVHGPRGDKLALWG